MGGEILSSVHAFPLSCLETINTFSETSNNYPDVVNTKRGWQGFPGGPVVKNPPASAGDTGLILVWEDPTCLGATEPVPHSY